MSAPTETLVVPNGYGLHLRAAAATVRAASRFVADVWISRGDARASARSTLGLLTLGAGQGSRLTVTGQGADAAEAVQAVVAVIRSLGDRDEGGAELPFGGRCAPPEHGPGAP